MIEVEVKEEVIDRDEDEQDEGMQATIRGKGKSRMEE